MVVVEKDTQVEVDAPISVVSNQEKACRSQAARKGMIVLDETDVSTKHSLKKQCRR